MQSKPRLARALGEDALDELTDPILGTNYDGVDMRRLIACAAAAVRSTARTRPRMGQVRWLALADRGHFNSFARRLLQYDVSLTDTH